jgi:peptidoglycan/LPS O-acetylase OafA/YrhL
MNPADAAPTEMHLGRTPGAEYYRADIDGLRGVAILSVLGFHAYPEYFPGGFVGVDVFFVVSGFLITSIILRQLERSRFTLADFYARRIRRIFPALVIVLPACLLFGWFALLPDELEHLGKHIASAATFVSNFTLWQESGYFDRAAELKPLLHLWSLGIEEQFYLLWPVLILLLWKRRRNIAVSIALLTAASFALSVAVAADRPTANFYFPFTRFWELGLGCLLAVVMQSSGPMKWFGNASAPGSDSLRRFTGSALPIVGVGLIVAAIFLLDRRTTFPGWAALIPTVGAMCIICARTDSWFQRRIMASAGLVFIGLISYPLYLWHWPLLSYATILEAGTPENTVRFAAVLLSVALAWLTFACFERPVRAQRSTRVSLSLAAGLLILGVAGLVIYATSGFAHRFDSTRVAAIQPEPRTNALCVERFPGKEFNYCKSTSAAPPAAVIMGDSRAQGIYDGIAALMGSRYPLMLLGRGGCPPLLDARFEYAVKEDCNEIWNEFSKYVREVKPSVVILVGGGSSLVGDSTNGRGETAPLQVREAALKHGLRALIVALQETSRVIYVRELPTFDSAPSCFLRRIRLPRSKCSPTVDRNAVEEELAAYNRIVDDVERQFPALRVVDSIPALCGGTVCSQQSQSGEIIYRDDIHLSSAGGRRFVRTSGLLTAMVDQIKVSDSS